VAPAGDRRHAIQRDEYAAGRRDDRQTAGAPRALRQTDLLQNHTVETGAQEIAAIILATALIARERKRAANGQGPVLRVKFGVVLAITRSMWFVY
jgi:hypothetical protein